MKAVLTFKSFIENYTITSSSCGEESNRRLYALIFRTKQVLFCCPKPSSGERGRGSILPHTWPLVLCKMLMPLPYLSCIIYYCHLQQRDFIITPFLNNTVLFDHYCKKDTFTTSSPVGPSTRPVYPITWATPCYTTSLNCIKPQVYREVHFKERKS